jgi:ribosome biogenesis GTPase
MTGKIIKGISGFYYVHVAEAGIYECKAKGIFRNKKIRPLVGDDVRIAVIDEDGKIGNIEEILPRKSELIRPAVANVDMALVIFAAAKPDPNFNLLDRFLCMMEYRKLPVAICFNKSDLVSGEDIKRLTEIYAPAGYGIIFTSAEKEENISSLRELLEGKTTTVAGPSGAGKSSLINLLQDNVFMETGAISAKIERGKHTTRHSQLIPLSGDTYIVDTPGFGSMDLPEIGKEALWTCYPEFLKYEPQCRFIGCSHIGEPGCGVKAALERGEISRIRYDNYMLLYEELKKRRKYL